MELFKDEIIEEYTLWQESNPDNFTWWNYLNIKSDIKTALGNVEYVDFFIGAKRKII